MVSTTPHFLQAVSLKRLSYRNGGPNVHSKDKQKGQEADCPDPTPRSTGGHVLSMTSPNNNLYDFFQGAVAHKSIDSWSVCHDQIYHAKDIPQLRPLVCVVRGLSLICL